MIRAERHQHLMDWPIWASGESRLRRPSRRLRQAAMSNATDDRVRYACPSWCQADDHARTGTYDPFGPALILIIAPCLTEVETNFTLSLMLRRIQLKCKQHRKVNGEQQTWENF